MKHPLIYVENMFKMILWKIKYPKRLTTSLFQSFEKVRFDIHKGGHVRVGEFNQNRGGLYFGCNNGELSIGSHCFFNINASITCINSITIGDKCTFGNNLVIVDHDHNFRTSTEPFSLGTVQIGNNVWCGANVVILKNTEIGDNCVIGANSVISGKISNNSVVVQKKVNTIRKINE